MTNRSIHVIYYVCVGEHFSCLIKSVNSGTSSEFWSNISRQLQFSGGVALISAEDCFWLISHITKVLNAVDTPNEL